MRPRDEAEAMLAVQMVATNRAALDMLARARHAGPLPTLQQCGNLAVKLLRTYTAQIEALAKLRRGGEQTVRVEHVHIHPGAQAVVGSVTNHSGRTEPPPGGRLANVACARSVCGGRALSPYSRAPSSRRHLRMKALKTRASST